MSKNKSRQGSNRSSNNSESNSEEKEEEEESYANQKKKKCHNTLRKTQSKSKHKAINIFNFFVKT